MSATRIVITGMGAVTGFGFEWQTLWEKMLGGEHCVRPWQPEDLGEEPFPVRYAAAVDMALMPQRLQGHPAWDMALERRSRFGWVAATQAVADSRLSPGQLRDAAVLCASGAPQHMLADMLLAQAPDGREPDWSHLMNRSAQVSDEGSLRQSNDRLARVIADDLGCEGPVINISSACAGAAQAIGNAFRMIRRGEVNVALAGGADSVLNLDTMAALYLLGAASGEQRWGADLCRPFDRDRSGLIAGEGGGFVVLESLEHALARGATPYAEVLGFGSSLDAYKVTAPQPEGRGAALAMQAALDDAGLRAAQIDLINAHGTSTPLNDVAETLAIKKVFAEQRHYRSLAVSANKSQFGHLIAAAGAPECIVTALACLNDLVTPTVNLHHADEQCDLDYCPGQAVSRRVDFALSNSFGFGGLNTSLALGKYREQGQ
ncbi:beta-ketoacyl-[acyl-carrier-protein] synthase family protein [Pseudomonas sp. COR58]|uniref:Beta-ketoacyl-[acyl-carrier-protein] synthase family protein n=1 Tax=Pseudomonas ekonensis TaxID=2842353 RepID=A0ABS6PJ43_9PSED|nr:beta-ketoacyl-[acyl-carrier-protein] synthase family protein [Pseudomonas ekonensis]MBV4460450.1 beta-ketoacyl-[acyl-carrier-protein] synthase family protein [Pseudomonas ekonensis]